MKRLRRSLLEFWAMFIIACVVGFMGPFGTYSEGDLVYRIGRWSGFLAGAYVLVRPVIVAGQVIARHTALPGTPLLIWGVLLSSFPVSLVWTWGSAALFNSPMLYAVALPFSLICAVAVLAVVWWAERIELKLDEEGPKISASGRQSEAQSAAPPSSPTESAPRLRSRLSTGFRGPIFALQSEDHYVRVHGETQSELILIRLRDAIAEMDGIDGEQVHRSWWVAKDAVTGLERRGRTYNIRLSNEISIPIARDSIERLQEINFIS